MHVCARPHPRRFWPEFWKWSGKINNLAGSIAYCCVLALWLSSLETVRRRMYQVCCAAPAWSASHGSAPAQAVCMRARPALQGGLQACRQAWRSSGAPCLPTPPPARQLFFRLHIACFLGFMLFACAHYPTNWLYFAPGAWVCEARHTLGGCR